jgi:hypothetical protein
VCWLGQQPPKSAKKLNQGQHKPPTMPIMEEWINEEFVVQCRKAGKAVKEADVLLVVAGAGYR